MRSPVNPTRCLIICTAQRTGGSMLDEALRATRIAGDAMECFNPGMRKARDREWRTPGDREYVAELFRRSTTANGVFAGRFHWDHVDHFLRTARRLPGYSGLDASAAMDQMFPGARYIWLTRKDKLRQAISMYRAHRTGIFRITRDGKHEPAQQAAPEFRFFRLARYLANVEASDAGWTKHFRDGAVEPLRLTYEDDICGNLEELVRRILDFAGISATLDRPITISSVRQADEHTERLVSSYRRAQQQIWAPPLQALATNTEQLLSLIRRLSRR